MQKRYVTQQPKIEAYPKLYIHLKYRVTTRKKWGLHRYLFSV